MLLDALAVTGSRLFEAGHADNEQKEILEYPHGIEKKILRALGDGNKEETKKYIDEFLDTVVSLSYDAKDIRRVEVYKRQILVWYRSRHEDTI